ncbi:MAG: type II secretion system F family protein [Lachnospiraceae bacterium]|nr:type II secretion system F family protein [Lachnospiraceae bacterium]
MSMLKPRYLGRQEKVKITLISAAALLVFSRLCFRSWPVTAASMLLVPLILYFSDARKGETMRIAVRKQFTDVLALLLASVSSGETLEKAIRGALPEMSKKEKDFGVILPLFQKVCLRLDLNVPFDEALGEFARSTSDPDIKLLTDIILTAEKSGGPLPDIIKKTIRTMQLRNSVNEEISAMLAGKRGELVIMLIMPAAVLAYMCLCSPGFTDPFTGTSMGRFMLAVSGILYAAAAAAGLKIIDIKI